MQLFVLIAGFNAKEYNCLLQISDFGLTTFRDVKELAPPGEEQNERNFDMLLWRAPELMRQQMPAKGSQVRFS